MKQLDAIPTRPTGLWALLAIATVTGASVVTFALPATTASADPVPAPPGTTAAPPPAAGPNASPDTAPGPGGPTVAPSAADPVAGPPGTDPNTPPPPGADPNAPEPGRVDNPAGGFSYVVPAGWVESDPTHLDYGSAMLSKEVGPSALGQPPQIATDTRVVLGRLDQKLYASAEPTDTAAATRLASDMGEFFMPFPGTRFNQTTAPLSANGMSGSSSYYEVKFSDTSKPNGQIWAGVIGPTTQQGPQKQRWFVVWLGTSNDPVDVPAATTLAQSIRPLPPPAAAPAPAPGAPVPGPAPGAPVPGAPAPAPMVPPPPAPASQNDDLVTPSAPGTLST